MIKIYANLILNNKLKLEDVPKGLRLAVETLINEIKKSNT